MQRLSDEAVFSEDTVDAGERDRMREHWNIHTARAVF